MGFPTLFTVIVADPSVILLDYRWNCFVNDVFLVGRETIGYFWEKDLKKSEQLNMVVKSRQNLQSI